MKRLFQLFVALMLILCVSIPKLSLAASDELVVTGEILNLREGPGLSYPILAKLKEGDTLSVIEKAGEWIHVKAGNKEGWVFGAYVDVYVGGYKYRTPENIILSMLYW